MQQITVKEIVWDQEEGGMWESDVGTVYRERTGKWWFYPSGLNVDAKRGPFKSMKTAMKDGAK